MFSYLSSFILVKGTSPVDCFSPSPEKIPSKLACLLYPLLCHLIRGLVSWLISGEWEEMEAGKFQSIHSEGESESLMMVLPGPRVLVHWSFCVAFPISLCLTCFPPLCCVLQYVDRPCLEPSPEHLVCAHLHPIPDDREPLSQRTWLWAGKAMWAQLCSVEYWILGFNRSERSAWGFLFHFWPGSVQCIKLVTVGTGLCVP